MNYLLHKHIKLVDIYFFNQKIICDSYYDYVVAGGIYERGPFFKHNEINFLFF